MSLRAQLRGTVVLAVLHLALVAVPCRAASHLEIESEHSFINVEVHVPLQNFRSHLAHYDAKVALGDRGEITAAEVQFRFADLHSGNGAKDAHMMSWLGGTDAIGGFVLETLTMSDATTGQALGLLEMHGVKQPVKFPVTVTREGSHLEVSGEVKFDYRQWDLPLLSRVGERVDPQLTVRFKLVGTSD